MAIGMTYEEYWYGDPWLVRAYREADKLRQERANESAWLHGLYVAMAISGTIGNAFREPGAPRMEYPQEPQSFKQKEPVDEDTEALIAKVYMNNMVRAGRDWGKRKEVSDGRIQS